MKKRFVAMLAVLSIFVCLFTVNAYAYMNDDVNENEVGFYGYEGNYYYVYYLNTSYWVGWHYSPSSATKMVAYAYLYMDGVLSPKSRIYDTTFDNTIDSAIRAYQYNHGLSQDGVIGSSTWRDMAYYRYGTSISVLLP